MIQNPSLIFNKRMSLNLHLREHSDKEDIKCEEGEVKDATSMTKFLMNLKIVIDELKERKQLS